MQNSFDADSVSAALRRINECWLAGRPEDLAPLLHPGIVMVIPGFGGQAEGRDTLVAGFADFCQHAKVHEYKEADHSVDVVGDTAVASFTYAMVYERAGERYRSGLPTGRYTTAEEVANLVLYLCSDLAGNVTGGHFVIDGGRTAVAGAATTLATKG